MTQFSRFQDEDYFEEYKDEILSLLKNENYNSPTIVKCNSFHDIFVRVFNRVHHIGFNGNPKGKNGRSSKNDLVKIPYNLYRPLNAVELSELKQIIESTYRTMACKISCPRGNAFLLCEEKKKTGQNLKENNNFKFYTAGSFSDPEHYGKLIINQIAPNTYAVLDISTVNEVEFDNTIFNYSFAIPHIVWAKKACGDIIFFNSTNLDFSRINVIDYFNSDKIKNDLIQHEFSRTSIRLKIELFYETDSIYLVNVEEIISVGRLKERNSYFSAKIDFKNHKWLSFKGHSFIESLK